MIIISNGQLYLNSHLSLSLSLPIANLPHTLNTMRAVIFAVIVATIAQKQHPASLGTQFVSWIDNVSSSSFSILLLLQFQLFQQFK